MRLFVLAIAALLALSGCQRKTDPPGEAPTGVTATPGDGLVVMSWDMLPDLTYWIFFEPGGSVAVAQPEARVIRDAVSPRLLGGLTNGTQYAFVMNATHKDSAAGPNAAPVVATPRLAGAEWRAGTPLGTPPQNLKGIAVGGSRFVVVGDAATIFAGDFSYTNPPGVSTATLPVSLPAGFAANLSAVILGSAYVALGTDGSIISSADGLTWTAKGSIAATGMNGLGFGLAVGALTYIAVGSGGAIFASTDLVTWTPLASGTTSDLTSISVFPGSFIVTGAGGTLLISLNGSTWTPLVSNTASTLRAVAYNAPLARYVAVGDAGTMVTSADGGVTWTGIAPVLTQDLLSITVGGASGSRFLAVGQGGAVAYSDDGINWSTASSGASLSQVIFASSMYLAVGDAGANVVAK